MSAESAVTWARAQVGTVEKPPNSNKGPKITQWQVDSGYAWVAGARVGVPWCQCFANAVAVKGGAPQLKDGFTPTVLSGKHQGFPRVAVKDAEPGDFIFFKFPGVSSNTCDHVGVLVSMTATTVTCVEGNTSPASGGSQNNGGGVWLKTRPRSTVAGAVSVPYTERAPYRSLKLGMRGSDVTAFQEATNRRADGMKRPDRRVKVDGVFGGQTRENGAWAAYILGVGDSTEELKSGGVSPYVQKILRDPDKRNAEQVARAGKRRDKYAGRD